MLNIVVYDADRKEHHREGRYFERNRRDAERHAERLNEKIKRQGWNMRAVVEVEPKRNPTYKLYGGREGSAEFRFMTLEEGKLLKYGDHIWFLANDGSARRIKVNGAPKRWKRQPDRVEVSVKYGMYEYATFTERDFLPSSHPRVLVML